MNLLVDIKLLHPEAIMPKYAHEGDSGVDLSVYSGTWPSGFAYLQDWESVILQVNERCLACTGVSLALPPGWEAQVRPRSSMSAKGIYCALGTIDQGYRGEIKVCLTNLSGQPYEIKKGDRIAQLVFAPVGRASLRQVQELGTTERGAGGFGSSGR